jgi:hypothetical protein
VVVKIIDADGTPKTAAFRPIAAVVVNKIRLAFKVDDGMVVGVAVAVADQFVQDAFKLPGPSMLRLMT